MLKKSKKIISATLSFLLLGAFIASPVVASADSTDSSGDFTIYEGELVSYNGAGGAVSIPDGVTSIGACAFQSAQGATITSIVIPNTVTSIEDYAFNGCANLTSVEIPSSVTSMGDGVFEYCTNLSNVTFDGSLSCISDYTFEDCSSLKSITFPNGITVIGSASFEDCDSFSAITIPGSVTSISDTAFWNCKNLKSITIPSSVKSIGDSTFYECPSNLVINCVSGSYAESYAESNSINYSTKLISIKVMSNPSKQCYKKGQAINLTGGVLQTIYGDGSTKQIPMISAKASGYNPNAKDGAETVTLTYGGKTCRLVVIIDNTAPKVSIAKKSGYFLLQYSDTNYSGKTLTLNGKKISWPGNGRVTTKGAYVATVYDKAGNGKAIAFKI